MSVADLVDHLGRPIPLGAKIGTGGEGSVLEVAGAAHLVAKLYHKVQPARSHQDAKLRAMVAMATKDLCSVAAWPTGVAYDRASGALRGLVMHKIKDYKEAHTLYSPAHRKTTFPQADWPFLIHTAANCAAAFDRMHRSGVVVGDVNQSNVMVSAQGLVHLIDCDSFQVQANGQTYTCDVGVPLFTAPELQGRPFRSLIRIHNHDRFGLAVLIFHFLFVGRHPFSGRHLGAGDLPLEKAIAEFRFAYGRSAQNGQVQPPGSLPLAALTPPLAALFERAFGPGSVHPDSRPTPTEWFEALKAFAATLRPCAQDPGHVSPSHVKACVWCDLIKQGAPNFFISVSYFRAAAATKTTRFDLATIWTRVDQVRRPNPAYSRPYIPPSRAPKPWPHNLPGSMPSILVPPSILTSPPSPPLPNLPPQRCLKRLVSPQPKQKSSGAAAIILGAAVIPAMLLGATLGQAVADKPGAIGWASGGLVLVMAIVTGTNWLRLEISRRVEQARINQDYEVERAERKALACEQLERWKRDLGLRQVEARRNYEAAARYREEIRAAILAEAEGRKKVLDEAWIRTGQAEWACTSAMAKIADEFDRKKAELAALRDRHNELAREYTSERQQLQGRAREIQMAAFLDQQFISNHSIPDIGPTRKATLASYGIETALDVTEANVDKVPGFGSKLTNRLVGWRLEIENRFVFNVAAGIPPREQQLLDQKYFQARQPIEIRLLSGEKELQDIARKAQEALPSFLQRVRSELERVAQATADLAVVPKGIL